jgi:hypothetical protein
LVIHARPAGIPGEGNCVLEDPPSPGTLDEPIGPDADLGHGYVSQADGTGLTETIVGHLADQARRTASAAKAGRVLDSDGEPGVLDLTPLRELLSGLAEELQQLRLRDRIASALRQTADIIDPQAPGH